MSARCYTLRLSEDPDDVAIVRLDISNGEPTEDELDVLRQYLAAARHIARERQAMQRGPAREQGNP